jgi:hypothetical protein
MGETSIARFLGAGLAAAAITTAMLTDWHQCGGNGLRGWVVFLTPVIVAVVYSFQTSSLAAYFLNGIAAVFGLAAVAGFYGSVVESPSACELLYGNAQGYFIFWGIQAFLVLALGSVPFGVLLLLSREAKKRAARVP